MGDQKLDDLEAMWITQGFEHPDQSLLLLARDVQRATGFRECTLAV
jgi:hypothetical protein